MKYEYYANRLWCSHKNMLFANQEPTLCVSTRFRQCGTEQSSVCVSQHTPDTDSNDAKKKNWSKATNVIWDELPHQSYFIRTEDWRGARETKDDWSTRLYCKFRYTWLWRGRRTKSAAQHQHQWLHCDISLFCLRRPFYTIYWYQILHFSSHLLFSVPVESNVDCSLRKRRKGERTQKLVKGCQTARWTIRSRNTHNNHILLKFVIGHDKDRPFCRYGGGVVAARICANHTNAFASIHGYKSKHPTNATAKTY